MPITFQVHPCDVGPERLVTLTSLSIFHLTLMLLLDKCLACLNILQQSIPLQILHRLHLLTCCLLMHRWNRLAQTSLKSRRWFPALVYMSQMPRSSLMKFKTASQTLTNPPLVGPPFHFHFSLFLRKSSAFRLELNAVTLQKPAVFVLKDSISQKLQQIDSQLKTAKADWTQEQYVTGPWKPLYMVYLTIPVSILFFWSETFFSWCPSYSAHHYQKILLNVDPILQITFFMVVASACKSG